MDGEVGVVGVAGPVVADGDQRPAVSGEARIGGGVGYEGSVGAVGRVQVGGVVLRRRGQGQECGQSGRREDRGGRAAGSVQGGAPRIGGGRRVASLQSTGGGLRRGRLIPKLREQVPFCFWGGGGYDRAR